MAVSGGGMRRGGELMARGWEESEGGGGVGQLFDHCFPRSERRGIRSALRLDRFDLNACGPVMASSALFFLSRCIGNWVGFCWVLAPKSRMGSQSCLTGQRKVIGLPF